jgi:phage shock protein A
MKQMRADYQEVAEKRSYYLARMEAARLQQRMNERAGGFGSMYNAPRAFNRLEDRVSDMEMQAKTLRDVRRMGGFGYGGGAAAGYSPMNPAVDAELAALRKKLEREGG